MKRATLFANHPARVSLREWGKFKMIYVKRMGLAEWASLQKEFADLFIALLSPSNMAMFVQVVPGEDDRIAIHEGSSVVAQGLSPGGWEPVEKLEGKGWAFLSGNADAPERLGVTLGK